MIFLSLWHMHQPLYRSRKTYAFPWVFLHAIREYHDFAAALLEAEGVRTTVNFVPTLLEQLQDYVEGRAKDRFLDHFHKRPEDMTEEEAVFLLEHFFSVHPHRIRRFPRYVQLLARRGGPLDLPKKLRFFRPADLRDLQVLFLLAYVSEIELRRDPGLRELVQKGRGFTEEDKGLLWEKAQRILRRVLPLYRRLHEEGKIELSYTPYAHPILPLLIDTEVARRSMPWAALPDPPFRHPEDARLHVQKAQAIMKRFFGIVPEGVWPAEGAVSEAALELLARAGTRWTLTDEGILERTLGVPLRGNSHLPSERIYRSYRFRDTGLTLFFRDRELSDRIGFVYGYRDPVEEAREFVEALKGLKHHLNPPLVVIALDGENPWDHYRDGGVDFLRTLFEGLARSGVVCPAFFSEALEAFPPRETLSGIHPGSWIGADFRIWIGHPEKNRAWALLTQARRDLDAAFEQVPEVQDALLAAEGSDWFWWLGEDNPTYYAPLYDELFRGHLRRGYEAAGKVPPPALDVPIKGKGMGRLRREPGGFIDPVLDGKVTSYFEWAPAGQLLLEGEARRVREVHFGFTREGALCFRVDFEEPARELFRSGLALRFQLITENRRGEVVVRMVDKEIRAIFEEEGKAPRPVSAAAGRVLELCVPPGLLGRPDSLYLALVCCEGGVGEERHPLRGFYPLHPPDPWAEAWGV